MKNGLNITWRLFVTVISVIILFMMACNTGTHKKEPAQIAAKEVWTCSMHPEIIRDRPGSCPICGMDLIRKVQDATAIAGIQLEQLLQPTDRFIVSSIPLTAVIHKKVEPEIGALGTIGYDTRQTNTISARVSGRIEKIYVHYRYQHVMKGERILDIYSPELQTAQEELLFLVRNDPDNASLIHAARQKLLLLGMKESELQQVIRDKKPSPTVSVYSNYTGHLHESGNTMPVADNGPVKMKGSVTEELPVKEGMYLQKGQVIFQLFNTDKSWVVLNIFPESQYLVKVGDAVKIIPETAPEKALRAKIDFIEPVFRTESKTLTARVYFDNASRQIPVGSQVRATIFPAAKTADWLPESAVLSLGYDKVVFLRTDGGFRSHKVETGMIWQNMVQVLSGLSQTDSVAVNAQYLTDSEGFIKTNKHP